MDYLPDVLTERKQPRGLLPIGAPQFETVRATAFGSTIAEK
jgi:hypothetical protein